MWCGYQRIREGIDLWKLSVSVSWCCKLGTKGDLGAAGETKAANKLGNIKVLFSNE